LASKIFYTIDEVSELTKLPQMLILHYLRVKGITLAPEHYPDINPRRVKGELLFSKKDVDEIFRFIGKKKDETWEKWQLRRIKEIMAKRELNIAKPEKKPDLKIINGGKKDKLKERKW